MKFVEGEWIGVKQKGSDLHVGWRGGSYKKNAREMEIDGSKLTNEHDTLGLGVTQFLQDLRKKTEERLHLGCF